MEKKTFEQGYRAIINFYYCRFTILLPFSESAIEPLLISTIVDAPCPAHLTVEL